MTRFLNELNKGATVLIKAVVLYCLLFVVDGYREAANTAHVPILFAVLVMTACGFLFGILLTAVLTVLARPKHGFAAAVRNFVKMLGYVTAIMTLIFGASTYFQNHPSAGFVAILGFAVAVAMWIAHFVLTASAVKKTGAEEKSDEAVLAANRKGAGNDETDR